MCGFAVGGCNVQYNEYTEKCRSRRQNIQKIVEVEDNIGYTKPTLKVLAAAKYSICRAIQRNWY